MVAAELTASSRDDASTLPDLLAPLEVPIRRFTADGAYDHRSVYDRASAAGTENVVIVIPPRRSALSAGPTDGPWAQRALAGHCPVDQTNPFNLGPSVYNHRTLGSCVGGVESSVVTAPLESSIVPRGGDE